MHDTSYEKMGVFIDTYLRAFAGVELEVLDLGSQVVHDDQGTYRTLFTDPAWHYHGLDVEAGANVDIAVEDPYDWTEVASDRFDLLISGQALEHIEYFWCTAFELGRVLKPGGLAVLIAPSNGFEHRYPQDCWRYYSDGFRALTTYLGFELVDVFTDWGRDTWQDSIVVMRKPQWDVADNERFLRRGELQRQALDLRERPVQAPTHPAAPSPLAEVEPGLLSPRLEEIRQRWLADRAAEHAAAVAADQQQRAELEQELETRRAEDAARRPTTPTSGWRGLAAKLGGQRGLAVYRALRYGTTDPTLVRR